MELKAKREMLPGFHEEFEVTRRVKSARANHVWHNDIVIDVSQNRWGERITGGSGDLVRIYDGQDLLVAESDGAEYTLAKTKSAKDTPMPGPYGDSQLEWEKAKEIGRVPCGFSGNDHTCIVVEAPIKAWSRPERDRQITRMVEGTGRVLIDTETGIWLQWHAVEVVEGPYAGYQSDVTYSLKRLSYGRRPDEAVLQLPPTATHQVKELPPWNERRIKKQLAGKPAPELELTDIKGNSVSLSNLKGKTVLLDFWTTWCPPCLADAPILDKLYQKYGDKDLMILGISVSEDRQTVEDFLKKHPHNFPVALTSENVMPRPYQIRAFPTYIVVARDGTLVTAEEGDQGFGRLRKILQKAGMETE